MHVPTLKSLPQTRQNCLGCVDCKGLCSAVIDLAVLPETILRHHQSKG